MANWGAWRMLGACRKITGVKKTHVKTCQKLTLNDGALPGRHTVRGGVLLSSGLGQHGDGTGWSKSHKVIIAAHE